MDLFQIVLFISLIVGILMVIVSMIILNNENKTQALNGSESQSTAKAIETSIGELDKNIEEFENLSKTVFEELDQKYQEVLFLYNLLDEKRQEIAEFYYENKKTPKTSEVSQPRKYYNPKASEILELKKQGLEISEIAKQLDMGKGEVRLIIELSK